MTNENDRSENDINISKESTGNFSKGNFNNTNSRFIFPSVNLNINDEFQNNKDTFLLNRISN